MISTRRCYITIASPRYTCVKERRMFRCPGQGTSHHDTVACSSQGVHSCPPPPPPKKKETRTIFVSIEYRHPLKAHSPYSSSSISSCPRIRLSAVILRQRLIFPPIFQLHCQPNLIIGCAAGHNHAPALGLIVPTRLANKPVGQV